MHIGSPVREIEPFESAVRVVLELIELLEGAGHSITVLDLGGGWPMNYSDGESPDIETFANALIPLLKPRVEDGLRIVLEPGRSIMANAGVLLTRVHHVKEGRRKRFVICDAGIHTLIRPAFYGPFILSGPFGSNPATNRLLRCQNLTSRIFTPSDLVGPICETGDFLARERNLPKVQRGDLVAIFSAGAYGMSMSSNYNDHPRSAEVLVDGERTVVINRRQDQATLLETEVLPQEL